MCAACTSRGYHLKVAFILLRASNRVATIRGQCLFEEIRYVCFLVGSYQVATRLADRLWDTEVGMVSSPDGPTCSCCVR